jgi:hypothetical protein
MGLASPSLTRAHSESVDAVQASLEKHGVEITADGVRIIGKPKR